MAMNKISCQVSWQLIQFSYNLLVKLREKLRLAWTVLQPLQTSTVTLLNWYILYWHCNCSNEWMTSLVFNIYNSFKLDRISFSISSIIRPMLAMWVFTSFTSDVKELWLNTIIIVANNECWWVKFIEYQLEND